jgi:predicted hydrocarbon binding protein
MLSSLLQKLLFVNQLDMKDGKIEILGNRYLLLDASFILALQKIDKSTMYSAAKDASTEQMKSIVEHAEVYKSMKDIALKEIVELSKKIGKGDEGVISTLQMLFDLYGLGKMRIDDLNNDKKNALVTINQSTLALERLKEGKTKSPICALTAGMLAGMFSYFFEKDVECVEKKCLARGDENCEFIIS